MKKKLIFIAVLAAVCAAFTGCSGKAGNSGSNSDSAAASNPTSADNAESVSYSDKTAKLMDEVEFPKGMVEMSENNLKMYGIDAADTADYSGYLCASGAMPDEFGIFEAVDADAADRIKSALESRIESQRKTYTDYTPDEVYKLDDSFVEINGNVVCYAICADNSKAKEIFAE